MSVKYLLPFTGTLKSNHVTRDEIQEKVRNGLKFVFTLTEPNTVDQRSEPRNILLRTFMVSAQKFRKFLFFQFNKMSLLLEKGCCKNKTKKTQKNTKKKHKPDENGR